RQLRGEVEPPWDRVLGAELTLLAALGMTHLALAAPDPLAAAREGRGGGLVGWALSHLLAQNLGEVPAWALLAGLALAGLLLLTRVSPRDLWAEATRRVVPWLEWLDAQLEAWTAEVLHPEEPVEEEIEPPVEPAAPPPAAAPTPAPRKPKVRKPARAKPRKRSPDLPPMDLLSPDSAEEFVASDLRLKSQIIEETLASFGIPAEVVEVHRGPTVTQFGVKPGYVVRTRKDGTEVRRKVRVSKIVALANDLALALSASPIRVEAPVPGRPVVGIEVPNEKPSLVALRGVMESEAFARSRSPLTLALGRDVSGHPVVADLAAMPHLLIAGATGSGKSVCINAIITCLLMENPPERLNLLLIDPKMVELTPYNGVPHLVSPVVVELEQATKALRWVTVEMENRYHLFAEMGVRDVEGYNRAAARRDEDLLPYLVVVIDELADLMFLAPDEVERHIIRIAQKARATGIHLVIATQRPSVDVVTGLIKANFPARISFAMASGTDSRVILDMAGAEKLLGRGDMLYMAPEASSLVRIQGSFVSDREIANVVRFWREAHPEEPTQEVEARYPWHSLEFETEEEDDLLDQALELLRGRSRISTSYLQRRLRLGYPRAARLMELLEAEGYVGPDEGGGRARRVIWRGDE
ncbi:MAG: DNA translocase FtsK, partial [Anaerolineae bacterium]|nr:DNA translocase FtsK [Anaerolineae bacterium]